MAITITQEKKRQRYLVLALVVIIFAIIFIVWRGFLQKERGDLLLPPPVVYTIPEVKIDWQLLEEIQKISPGPFKEISAFQNDFGRTNPFTPY